MNNDMNIGKAPARFSYYEQAGRVILLSERRYCFLFVLQGSIEMQGSCHIEILESHTFAVIDKQQVEICTCTAGTYLLEFLPPKRMDRFFRNASTAFGMPSSEHVAYAEDIAEWIEQLHNDCLQGIRPSEYSYCIRLRHLLRQYPSIVLGTLVIPLHACALTSGKCLQCKMKCDAAEDTDFEGISFL